MGDIYVEKYNDTYFKKWDDFIEKSKSGTIFHTRKFLSYHPKNKFEDYSLLFLKDGNIVSVLPACLIKKDNELVLASHQGSTYGGFVIPYKFGIEQSLKLVDLLLDFAHKNNIDKIWMRFPEYIFEKDPSEEIKFAMWNKGFKIDYIELSTCYDLSLYDEKKPVTRFARRSYEEGIKCLYNDENFSEFYTILYNNLKNKHQETPTHTLEEIYKLKELLEDRFVLISAYYKGSVVGGLGIFLANSKTTHMFYSAARNDLGRGIFVTDALMDTAIRKLKEKGFKYFNAGISTEEKGTHINFGLFKFKEKYKGLGVYREIWKWEKNTVGG